MIKIINVEPGESGDKKSGFGFLDKLEEKLLDLTKEEDNYKAEEQEFKRQKLDMERRYLEVLES